MIQSYLLCVCIPPASAMRPMTASLCSSLCIPHHCLDRNYELFLCSSPSLFFSPISNCGFRPSRSFPLIGHCSSLQRVCAAYNGNLAEAPRKLKNYEFSDGGADVELRLDLAATNAQSFRDLIVDADVSSLEVNVQSSSSLTTIFEIPRLYDKIKPAETIWFVDEEQLVINLKKHDADLEWPDLMESWDSLSRGVTKLLKGASIYIVGESTEINDEVASILAPGIGYTPLSTGQLLQSYAQQSIDSLVNAEGGDSVAQGESAVIEGVSSHVRAVVATLGGQHGASRRADQWRHLYAGFTIWLSQTDADDETSAKDEARWEVQRGVLGYSNADLVVKFSGWEPGCAPDVAQACLSALKQRILSDKQLPEKKSLYIRLGCRGDWPNIKPPGWNPSES